MAATRTAYRCATDADCTCSAMPLCGSVLPREILPRLEPTARRLRELGCESAVQCPEWACAPTCVDGACVNAPGTGASYPVPTFSGPAPSCGEASRRLELGNAYALLWACRSEADCACDGWLGAAVHRAGGSLLEAAASGLRAPECSAGASAAPRAACTEPRCERGLCQ